MSRILIIGATSSLAAEFIRQHKTDELILTDRLGNAGEKLDLADLSSMSQNLVSQRFDYAIVFAGMTNIAECEQNPELAHQINCVSLAELQSKLDVENWILLSTNLVFSGKRPLERHDAPYAPFNQYGKSKAEMERIFRERCSADKLAIVRMTKVVNDSFTLLQNWLESLRDCKQISAFRDMSFSPVSSSQVVDFLGNLVASFTSGIYHLSGDKDISYYEAICTLALINELDPELVSGVAKTVDSPNYTSLLTDKREEALGFNAPSIRQILNAISSE